MPRLFTILKQKKSEHLVTILKWYDDFAQNLMTLAQENITKNYALLLEADKKSLENVHNLVVNCKNFSDFEKICDLINLSKSKKYDGDLELTIGEISYYTMLSDHIYKTNYLIVVEEERQKELDNLIKKDNKKDLCDILVFSILLMLPNLMVYIFKLDAKMLLEIIYIGGFIILMFRSAEYIYNSVEFSETINGIRTPVLFKDMRFTNKLNIIKYELIFVFIVMVFSFGFFTLISNTVIYLEK